MLAGGAGALIVPTLDETPEQVYEVIKDEMDSLTLNDRLRVLDFLSERPVAPWHLPMAPTLGREHAVRAMVTAEKALSGSPRRPFLELSTFDAFEKTAGFEAALRMFAQGAGRARQVGNTMIVWIRGDSAALSAVQKLADHEVSLARNQLDITVRGVRPNFASITL
jgi:hypothetical protein